MSNLMDKAIQQGVKEAEKAIKDNLSGSKIQDKFIEGFESVWSYNRIDRTDAHAHLLENSSLYKANCEHGGINV